MRDYLQNESRRARRQSRAEGEVKSWGQFGRSSAPFRLETRVQSKRLLLQNGLAKSWDNARRNFRRDNLGFRLFVTAGGNPITNSAILAAAGPRSGLQVRVALANHTLSWPAPYQLTMRRTGKPSSQQQQDQN